VTFKSSIFPEGNCWYLGLDHSLWNGIHGIIEPTFQAFGKVANGLSQGTWKTTTTITTTVTLGLGCYQHGHSKQASWEVCLTVAHWEWVSGHQGWGSPQGPGTLDGHRYSSIWAQSRSCTVPVAVNGEAALQSHLSCWGMNKSDSEKCLGFFSTS